MQCKSCSYHAIPLTIKCHRRDRFVQNCLYSDIHVPCVLQCHPFRDFKQNPLARLQNPLVPGYGTRLSLHAVVGYATGQKVGDGETPWQVEQAKHILERKISRMYLTCPVFQFVLVFFFGFLVFFSTYTQGACSQASGTARYSCCIYTVSSTNS